MGRRSINTTKSGKYMNPTDQARKEARKKELKKNKRQRQMVRAAVLKMKDPNQILEELQKIDEMEFNVLQPSPLNEKVLKEKRKKLRETFDRVLKMYDKDDPEKWVDLKRQEMEYEKRRAHLISYYESVKHAQAVQVDEIPLPTLQLPDNMLYGSVPSIPLPMDTPLPNMPMKPILKKDSVYKEKLSGLEPPGVPPGPPPDYNYLLIENIKKQHIKEAEKKTIRFSDLNDELPPGECANDFPPAPVIDPKAPEGEFVDGEEMETEVDMNNVGPGGLAQLQPVTQKPTSLQQRMLALSGQNIDDFMKEMEEVHRKRERDRAADLNARLSALKQPGMPRDSDSDSDGEVPINPLLEMMVEPPGVDITHMPPPMMPAGIRPPPLRMPPGPPPGLPTGPLGAPPGPPPGLPPRAILRPPGPPPGAPPRLLRPLVPPPPPKQMMPVPSVLTAAPQLIPKKDGQGATISAKPQIRNLSADVTRFVPSSLRVKREDKRSKMGVKIGTLQKMPEAPKPPSKDDAYMQFMREMEGLL